MVKQPIILNCRPYIFQLKELLMKYISILLLAAVFLLQCGGSDLEEGNANFADGKFTQAINNYKAFKKDNPDNKEIDARITLAFFNKGKQLYDKSKNIASFSGNFEKGQEYLPEDWPSQDLQNQYSDLLYELANAYYTTNPENSVQKEEYFNNSLEYLDQALSFNPENTKADDKLKEIQHANFQKMFDSGMAKFKEAKKTKNSDLYISAEWYFKKAVEFSGGNAEAEKYLNDTRKQTINILSYRVPLNFCVTGYQVKNGTCFIALAIQNFSDANIAFNLNSLILKTTDGDEVKPDIKKTIELEAGMKDKSDLAPHKLVEGQLSYTVKSGAKLAELAYHHSEKTIVTRYFPL